MTRFWKSGEPFIWLTGGALALALLLVAGLVALILASGLGQMPGRRLSSRSDRVTAPGRSTAGRPAGRACR